MRQPTFHNGDRVIYTKCKFGLRPGRRARNVQPAEHGDDYLYQVDKFWLVVEARDGAVVVLTRRGKRHQVSAADPNLRRAHWWEQWLYRDRFPHPAGAGSHHTLSPHETHAG